MIKLLDLLEKKMTSGGKKEKEKIVKDLKKSKNDFKKRYGKDAESVMYATATKRAMGEKLDPVGKEDADINNDGKIDKTDKYLANRRKVIAKNIKEENIPAPLVSLYDLVEKLVAQGITKEEILRIVNFATAKLDEVAKVRKEKVGGRTVELIISSKDKAEVEKEIDKIEIEYPSAGYGTRVKKSPYQKGDTWIAVITRGTTSD